MKKVLLTGTAGFIGAETAKQLLSKGYQVVGVDNKNDYYDVKLKDYRLSQIPSKNFSFHHLNIENKANLDELFESEKFDAVINLAARPGVRYSIENPFVYASTNFNALINILEAMKNHGIKKLVLASTSSLYAGEDAPFSEDMAVNRPLSPYAATKKAAEMMAFSYHHLYNLDINVVRYFTVYGPAGRPDMMVFRFIYAIDKEIPFELYGDGSQSRDFTYVDDIARGTILALEKGEGFNVINLGGGKNPISTRLAIEKMEKLLNKKAKVIQKDFHKADMQTTYANIEKAEHSLAWKPEITFDEGLKRSVDWHIENRELCSKISGLPSVNKD